MTLRSWVEDRETGVGWVAWECEGFREEECGVFRNISKVEAKVTKGLYSEIYVLMFQKYVSKHNLRVCVYKKYIVILQRETEKINYKQEKESIINKRKNQQN